MPSFGGSIAPGAKDDRYRRAVREKILTPDSPLLIGLRTLEAHLGAPAFAALAVEMGGLNTAVAAVLGAIAGIPFVDGDTIGQDSIGSWRTCPGPAPLPEGKRPTGRSSWD